MGTLTGTGTVTITVGGPKIWYVDNAYAGATSDGRSNTPFKSLSAVSGASGPDAIGDVIHVRTGSGAYAGGIALQNNQALVGEGVALQATLGRRGAVRHGDRRAA